MKKIVVFFIVCLCAFAAVNPLNAVFAENLSDSIVLLLSESHTDDQIVIDANLVTNTGVSAMTLELVYDKTAFQFERYERGAALSELDLMSTDLSKDDTLPVKFNWLNLNKDVENSFSTGLMLRLYFTLKPDCKSGDYEIGFKYDRKSDIIYIDNRNQMEKFAVIDKAVVNIAENKITDISIKTPENAGAEGSSDVNIGLIVGIALIAVAALTTAITLSVVKIRKGNRRKKNWLKV